jgi:hypothetical protein
MIFNNPLIPLVLDLESADPRTRLQAGRKIAQQLAVPGFLDTLISHRLTPLLYQVLTQFSREEVGQVPHLEVLRWDYFRGLRLYKIQESETRRFVEVLADAGVEVVLLKGADIRHRLYDDPVCRPMNDIDVLISPADLEKARTALSQKGYVLAPWCLDPQPGFNSRFDYDITFATPSRTIPLDFHWELREVGTYYRLPYAPLRARAAVQDLEGCQALVLSPEHLLMHLSLHTFDELETAGILKIVDLDRALTCLDLDWDFFLKEAAAFQIQGPMFWILREMNKLRPKAVPEVVWQRLAAFTPGWSERFILRRTSMSLSVALLASLWRYVPVKEWPFFFQGKLWPSADYIRANSQEFSSRTAYLQHLLRRSQDKT